MKSLSGHCSKRNRSGSQARGSRPARKICGSLPMRANLATDLHVVLGCWSDIMTGARTKHGEAMTHEEKKKYMREYGKNNREAINARKKGYYAKEPDKFVARTREW